jgi:nicotinamidase-related amidase
MSDTSALLTCDADSSVLLVIDIQTKLTKVMPIKVLARLQRHTGVLIKAANTLKIPVFVTEQYPKGLGHLEQEISVLLTEDARRYEKTSFSCAGTTEFVEALSRSGRKQVILVGMEAHVCVLQTAMDLQALGYQIFVVADAVCSRHRESYETALNRMRQAGVIIVNAESVLFEWLRDAKHEQFKTVQSLIT